MLSFLFIYFLTCLLPDVSVYSFQNRPIPFPGRRSYQVTKPGFSFSGLFYVVVYFVIDARLLLDCLFQFFSTKPRDWLRITSPKWPVLCWVGCKTLTLSINQSNLAIGRVANLPPLQLQMDSFDFDPHLIHAFLDPHESAPQMASWSVHTFFICSSICPTYRHTDYTTCDVCSSRSHLMQCRRCCLTTPASMFMMQSSWPQLLQEHTYFMCWMHTQCQVYADPKNQARWHLSVSLPVGCYHFDICQAFVTD